MGESPDAANLTSLLNDAANGDREAISAAYRIVEQELRRLAHKRLRGRYVGPDLQTTLCVNEAFLQLVGDRIDWESRRQFFRFANRVMWDQVIKAIRRLGAAKRGGRKIDVDRAAMLDQIPMRQSFDPADVLALHEAIAKLQQVDPEASEIVRWRYLGCTLEEIAGEFLGVSLATVNRQWRFARSWLRQELQGPA